MLAEVQQWGIKPRFVTGDSWYSCIKNLKTNDNHRLGFLFALVRSRLVSIEKNSYVQIQSLDIPKEGLEVWLREFGHVKVFRTYYKKPTTACWQCIYLTTNRWILLIELSYQKLHDQHWLFYQYHRVIKQVCHIEHFQVRSKTAICNHIFASLCGYVRLQHLRATDLIGNCYSLQRNLFNEVITIFIETFMPTIKHLDSQIHKMN